MKRMIFHIPMKIDRNRASASQIRPMKMIEAFKECGYEVAVVEGYGKERKRTQISQTAGRHRLHHSGGPPHCRLGGGGLHGLFPGGRGDCGGE